MPLFYHCLCLLALLVNASVLWTAWLVTPKKKLLAYQHSLAVGWLAKAFFLSLSFLAYWRPEVVVMMTSACLLIAASNAVQIPLARALGEEAVLKLAIEASSKAKFWPGLLVRILPAFFYAFLAVLLFVFYPTTDAWGFWIALGVAVYSIEILLSRTIAYRRYRKLGGAPFGVR